MKKFSLFFLLFCAILVSAQSPLSKFSAAISGANSVTFTNESTESPTSFTWEFTGGTPSSSTSPNPSVTYTTAGIYTAKLTVNNASGSSVSTRTIQVSAANVVDLCTGRNDDGTIMPEIGASDNDWKYTDPNGVTSTPITRHSNAVGWYSASTGGVAGITRWITGNNVITGDHYYESKEFEIPNGVTTAVLNLRSLSFVRNWTYLVKKNSDGSETESLVTATTWMSDGAKGWLNSRSPEVINYPLTPGKYYVKVKVYTNNTGQRQATDVNANVNFGLGFTFSPIAEFSATPTSTNVGSNVQFSNLSQGSPTSVSWNFEDGTNVLTSTQNNPTVAFSTVGNHYAELSANYGSGLLSSLKINNYIQTVQAQTPIVSSTQPSCSVSTGSITVTSPATGVTYSFDNGVSFQASNTLSGLAAGTYLIKVKNQAGSISDAVSVVINSALNIPQNPVLNIAQPACGTTTGSITVTSPSTDVQYSFDGGITYQTSNVKAGTAPGTYTIVVKNSSGCTSTATATIAQSDCRDWTKAPNSYIYTGKDANNNEVDGIYIPVKKAYAMWNSTSTLIAGNALPSGTITADVLWEDVHGLVKTGENYTLQLEGVGENAKIKVPVSKNKEGNAVVTFKINGEIYWSWHIWVTDDPSNGSTYKSYTAVQRQLANGTLENIPDSEWKWMDRNLGAVSSSLTGSNWDKNGGLLYQWGRKDPFPSLVTKGSDFYEVTGSINHRVRHYDSHETNQWAGTPLDALEKYVKVQDANVKDNIRLSIKNPLSLIYIRNNDNTNQAFYNGNANLPYNWFGTSSSFTPDELGELNLWSDNAEGKIINSNYNFNSQRKPYKNKSSYDPCPNGWRIPSLLIANLGSYSYVNDVRIDYSPFGLNPNGATTDNTLPKTVKPSNANMPAYMQNFKIYPSIGFDMTNVSGNNLGIFPGTGMIYSYNSEYTDQHETYMWTATMPRWQDTTPAIGARSFRLVPDPGQYINNYRPDAANFPNVWGRYEYYPLYGNQTSDGLACRCIKDPLFEKNGYDFAATTSDFFTESTPKYSEGLYNPNTYNLVKSSSVQTQEIPVSKAFSVQSQMLGNTDILNNNKFNNLKPNVLWTTNTNLIQNISMSGNPSTLADLSNTKIVVKLNPNQSGNAVITLHNGSITNPIYWSWHIWVTNSPLTSIAYITEQPDVTATNYINYIKKGVTVLQTEFMDRNLGAEEAFPTVANPALPNVDELNKIKLSGGMQYQWGRKDPIPPFVNPDGTAYQIHLGSVNTDGSITYTSLNSSTYNNASGSYIIPYNTYTNASNANVVATDKINVKMNKVLTYSIQNPLVFMVPSNFAPIFYNQIAYTNGSDWISNETNIAANRWGRADKKSPFDPCPSGWRIPDVASVSSDAQLSNFPWGKKDVNELGAQSIINVYNGSNVGNGMGYQFNDVAYKIGNYPFVGIRGHRQIMKNAAEGGTPDYTKLHSSLTGIWTASLNSNYYGRANNFIIDRSNNSLAVHNDNADPYFAMNCRCVKIKNQGDDEQGVILPMPVTPNSGKQAVDVFVKKEIEQKIISDEIVLYPNPVSTILYIDANDSKDYYYQIYNMSGQMVKKGKFENKQTNVSDLITGAYLVRINDSQAVVKIIKK
ncbi:MULTISPECIES: PKD domain-containing protein [Chryseobacterium]|uniref:PKD domain-containing protein n=1 Tax=Chryseobacterium TaxID=59732 RepID=UPI000C9E6324|nr:MULTISPECIES: PKD domain-containing protein [Chryseobacterium]VXC38384.1 Por secretion system C-terminal sorting domain-containing protein [Chryseobacterium sp. 8AT]